jgi:multidrug efflux system membrane fusion protein
MSPQTQTRGWLGRWWIWLFCAGLIGLGSYAYVTRAAEGQSSSGPPAQVAQRPVSVVASPAWKGDVGVYLTGLGSVTSLYTVTIKSRVDGELMKVMFKEGQIVTSGSVLAQIDPRPYQAQLTQAEGQMARDQALLKNAKLDLKRYEVLAKQDSIAIQQLDTQRALVEQYAGTVEYDQGQIDNAKVQVVYTNITAPVTGRIGLRLVDPGNIVHAADANGLAVITQMQPISVIFPIPEDNLQSVLTKLRAGEQLPVYAYNREMTQKLSAGYLLTIDNQIDQTTGTVKLRALFPNKDYELFPNQFVNALLLIDVKRGTTITPTAAVQRTSKGAFMYVVKDDKTVTARQVKLGPAEGDVVSVEEGLTPGEIVVVEGAEKLRDGSKVEVQSPGDGSTGGSNG